MSEKGKLKHAMGTDRLNDSDPCPFLPYFTGGNKSAKCGLNLAFTVLLFQTKATYLKFETHL